SYQAIPGAEKYQFVKLGPGGTEAGSVKIDILTGPQSRFQGTKVKTNASCTHRTGGGRCGNATGPAAESSQQEFAPRSKKV
ncbi:MAG: hypothetical protein WCG29_07720, partial [Desulfomonile sp.]